MAIKLTVDEINNMPFDDLLTLRRDGNKIQLKDGQSTTNFPSLDIYAGSFSDAFGLPDAYYTKLKLVFDDTEEFKRSAIYKIKRLVATDEALFKEIEETDSGNLEKGSEITERLLDDPRLNLSEEETKLMKGKNDLCTKINYILEVMKPTTINEYSFIILMTTKLNEKPKGGLEHIIKMLG